MIGDPPMNSAGFELLDIGCADAVYACNVLDVAVAACAGEAAVAYMEFRVVAGAV